MRTLYDAMSPQTRALRPEDRIPQDLALDSLASEELLIRLEDELGVSLLDNPQVAQACTVDELCTVIDGLRQAPQ
jgi:acyl carrier protein